MSEQTEAVPGKKPRVALWIATGFGLGYLPVAPGTWGSLAGVVLTLSVPLLSFIWLPSEFEFSMINKIAFAFLGQQLISAIVVASVGVWASQKASAYFDNADPRQVVIDEVSGQMIAYLPFFIPIPAVTFGDDWKYVVLGFILFRVFDVWKPWPIRRVEKLPGGWGIMADDWLAGGYAAVVLWGVRWSGWIG